MQENQWETIERVDRLKLVDVKRQRYLQKEGNSYWRTTEESGEAVVLEGSARPKIRQGFLEGSNVNAVTEMVEMIEVNRAYEANQKLIQTEDSLIGKLVERGGEGMMRSLWTAASGMTGQQFNIDTISNNLANVNTTGYKQMRPDFEDLLYQTLRLAGTPSTEVTVVPTGIQVGHGVKPGATQKIYTQGALQATGNTADIAIEGEGFFRVLQYDGTYGYTRDGSFKIDANGQFVNSNGYRLMPEVVLPEGFLNDSVAISQDGRITVKVAGSDDPIEVGQLELYRFVNPAGLQAIGENLVVQTNASGEPITGRPGFDGMGKTLQKYLEMSNVSVVKEMVNMIVAQRAYELNSRAIQTSDSMLATATTLKR